MTITSTLRKVRIS